MKNAIEIAQILTDNHKLDNDKLVEMTGLPIRKVIGRKAGLSRRGLIPKVDGTYSDPTKKLKRKKKKASYSNEDGIKKQEARLKIVDYIKSSRLYRKILI